MRRLRGIIAVNCPVDEAKTRIERFFVARRAVDGKLRLSLRLPLGRPGAGGFALDHEVCVDAFAACDDQTLNGPIRVSWKAEDDAPLPPFAGTIAAWAEGHPKVTFIELDGTYVAPFGVAGAIFDEVIGRRIAQRTANDLLAQIAAAIADSPRA